MVLDNMGRRTKLAVSAIGVLVAVALLSLLLPVYGEICGQSQQPGHENCASYHMLFVVFWYIGKIGNDYGVAITALATGLLAVITWRLVALGREQSNTTRAELRAYLSVVVGAGVYQDDKCKFEAKPGIINNGQTPAYNVRYRAKAEILSDSVAVSYTFTAPPDTPKSQSSIGPKENRLLSAILPYRVADSEVQDIMDGNGKALWVWGVVHYDDVFGKAHFTQFCQRLYWLKDRSNVFGIYDGRFGESD
jgi:hypothetical protein